MTELTDFSWVCITVAALFIGFGVGVLLCNMGIVEDGDDDDFFDDDDEDK